MRIETGNAAQNVVQVLHVILLNVLDELVVCLFGVLEAVEVVESGVWLLYRGGGSAFSRVDEVKRCVFFLGLFRVIVCLLFLMW